MEYLIYTSAGFIASALGAATPGAVNLSVVYTTINQGAKFAIPIILAAALGEVVLAFFALHCAMFIEENIQQNIVLQYIIAIILVLAGIFLSLKKSTSPDKSNAKKSNNGFFQGLLFAVLNPPVLVFWLLVFSYLATNTSVMVEMSFFLLTLLFFMGVFVGKIFTLWLYLQLSKKIEKRAQNITSIVNKSIGVLLLFIGCFQLFNLISA